MPSRSSCCGCRAGRASWRRSTRTPARASPRGTGAIATAVKGVQLAAGLDRTAEEMGSISLIRSMVSKEGDHERGTYTDEDRLPARSDGGASVDRGDLLSRVAGGRHRHPAARLASCRASGRPAAASSATSTTPSRPATRPTRCPIRPPSVPRERDEQRLQRPGRRGRGVRPRPAEARRGDDAPRDGGRGPKMMSSEQLKAFDVSREPAALRDAYGDTPFGRGCLAARRLIEVGVRCVEVTLAGWDTHANNHATVRNLLAIARPGLQRPGPRPAGAGLAGADGGTVRRRVRPDAEDQPGRRPRPLADRLQRGAGRRRHPRRPGDRRDRPGGQAGAGQPGDRAPTCTRRC